jgi:uncharacterized protein with FMN-binding domain
MRWGTIQVRLTVSGGKVSAVDLVEYPTDRRSGSINAYAAPVLEREAVAAQSANIDAVSGATYTSQAYATSLQSAIDQAAASTTAAASGTAHP